PHTTKACIAVGAARDVNAAGGAPRGVDVVNPIAAAQNTVASGCRSVGITASGIGCAIPIPTPLADIPDHVVQTITVRCKGSHRTRGGRGSAHTSNGVEAVRPQ